MDIECDFCHPVPERLENERVKLTPFIVEHFHYTEVRMRLIRGKHVTFS